MIKLWKLALGVAICAAALNAQTGLGTITGTVGDPAGAAVANAPVSVRNTETGQLYSVTSSDTGNFTVPQVQIGDYDLTVAVPGFKTYTHAKFHVAANQIVREDIILEVGRATESVTVTAEASLLKTESSEVAQNVTLSQLQNLPILTVASTNSGFRDPFSAVRLVPGARYTNGSNIAAGATAATTSLSINGTPSNTYGTRLDGMTMNPTGPRLIGAQMQTQPSVDAIEEVAIETSNFAAEFGAAGGAMINMQTKSGTNSYHGTIYDYGTNEALNAHQPYTGLRSKIRQADFGGTFGGAVRIPKLYNGTNKTFFFFSQEIYKQTNVVNAFASVPSAAYRLGDFSSLIPAENKLITQAATGVTPAKPNGDCPAGSVPTGTGPSCNVLDALGNIMASGTVFDPFSTAPAPNGKNNRLPFVGNKFPVSLFDPISAKVLGLIPNPQGGNFDKGLVTNNYTGTYDTSRTSKIPSIKLDHTLSSKSRISFYLQETNTRSPRTPTGADPLPALITSGATTFSSGTTIRLNYDYTITPRLLLHLGAGWNDSDFKLGPPVDNYDAFKELGLKGQVQSRFFPRLVTAVNANDQIGGLSPLGQTFPTASFERRPSGTASATYVTGRHTYKFGADWRMEKFPNYVPTGGPLALATNTTGGYLFGANYTEQPYLQGIPTNQGFDGFELASFLLGGTSLNAQVAPTALANIKYQTGIYAQDTWKLTRKITLDYGLRWDLGTYAHEQFGRNGSIGLAIPNPSASGRLGATQFEATCKCNFASNYNKAFGPRLGLAYQINSKTVLRMGFGVVYNATATNSGATTSSAVSTTLPANSGQISGLFRDGMPSSVKPVWPSFDAGVGQGAGTVITFPALLDPNAGRPARLMQWSIGLQREIGRNLVVEATYLGNRGAWWTAAGLSTLNALSQDTLQRYGFNNLTSATESGYLTALVSSLATNTAARTVLASRGITGFPYANFPTSQTVRQSLVDYPQYTGNGLQGSPLGKTWYDSFQLSVTKRMSHGLQLNMNYNFSKNLDLMTAPDVFNRKVGKNLSVNDSPHQLRLTAQYQVPELRRSGLAVVSNKWVSYALSGWGIGTYLGYQSAPLMARPTSNGQVPISNFLGRGPGAVGCVGCGAQLKKDADGNYMNPWSVNWTDNSGKQRTDPLDINCHCFDPTKTAVFNPNAWENIPDGQFAADSSSLRFFRGVRIPQENANFSRNFRFGKEGRFILNVRAEFNNIFNRLQLPAPVTNVNATSQTTRFTDPRLSNFGLYSGGYGTFTVAGSSILSGTGGQRTGTYVARLTF